MPVYLSFAPIAAIGPARESLLASVRASEVLATDDTPSTAASQPGEVAVITSTESGAVYIAWGTAPDADATAATTATTARHALLPDIPLVLAVPAGVKVSCKAIA